MAKANAIQLNELKAVATQPIAIANNWTRWEQSDASFNQLAFNGPGRNSAVAAAFLQFGIRFPEPPLKAYQDDKEIEHPALDAIRQNPIMDERLLMLYSIYYTLLGGNCYWYKVRGTLGQVVGIYPYSDAYVSPIAFETGLLSHYSIRGKNGIYHTIKKEDIVHLRWFSVDPSNHLKAQSPVAQLASDAETDNFLTQSINSILKNDATPKSAYMIDKEAAQVGAQSEGGLKGLFDLIKAKWREEFGGKQKGSTGIFLGGTIHRLAMGFDELDSEAIRSIPESRIAAVLGIPPILVGLSIGLDSGTYSNYEQAKLTFVQDILVPMWKQWGSTITKGLIEDESVEIRFDTDLVHALQDVKAKQEDRIIMLAEKSILTQDEAREKLGLEPMENIPNNELRNSVGGANALKDLQIAHSLKQILTPAARANATLLYGFTEDEAEALFPDEAAGSAPIPSDNSNPIIAAPEPEEAELQTELEEQPDEEENEDEA